VSTQDLTIGVFGHPDDLACWFLFFKVNKDKVKKGLDFPQWTEEEGHEICRTWASAKLSDKTTFGDVYANRYRMTTQAVPNHTLRRWHWGRLICLGDSVAKTNPILAQGGAQGAESVLMLIDRIHDALQQRKGGNTGSQRLPTAEIEEILSAVNKARLPRVKESVDKSQQIINISTWSGWLWWFVGKHIAPLLPTWVIVAQGMGPWKNKYTSTSLPAPSDPRLGFSTTGKSKGKDGSADKAKSIE
jgi:hypothetical protein